MQLLERCNLGCLPCLTLAMFLFVNAMCVRLELWRGTTTHPVMAENSEEEEIEELWVHKGSDTEKEEKEPPYHWGPLCDVIEKLESSEQGVPMTMESPMLEPGQAKTKSRNDKESRPSKKKKPRAVKKIKKVVREKENFVLR